MRLIAMTIAGMSRAGCVSAVRKALGSVPGTRVDEVSVGSATDSYDACITNHAAIAEAIGNAGYQVCAERIVGRTCNVDGGQRVMRRQRRAHV